MVAKAYPCWRIFKRGEKLPQVSFINGKTIDLSSDKFVSLIDKLQDNEMLIFYRHKSDGDFIQQGMNTQYLFGNNFTVSKYDDGSICVFGNGCLFEE